MADLDFGIGPAIGVVGRHRNGRWPIAARANAMFSYFSQTPTLGGAALGEKATLSHFGIEGGIEFPLGVPKASAPYLVATAGVVQDIGGVRGFRVTYTNLTTTGISADTTATIEASGTLEVQYSSATAGRTLSTLSSRLAAQTRSGSASVTFAANVTSQFTVTNGQIAVGRNLPAGQYALSGTLTVSYTASGDLRPPGSPAQASYTTNISTSTTMLYDGACQSDRAFRAGQLRGAVSGYASGSLTTSFSGCGSGETRPPGVKR